MADTWEWAIRFCEEHECHECPAYREEDKRTRYEKCSLHFPCCFNLVSPEEQAEFRKGFNYDTVQQQ